jgi:hypothetical protein
MKAQGKLELLAFVDKDNNLQGIDRDSGGYPYDVSFFGSATFWPLVAKNDADRYIRTINFGDKGYKIVKLTVDFGV